jgi:hypothetical protein
VELLEAKMRKRKIASVPKKPDLEICKTGTEAQTVLFDAKKWTVSKARKWLKEHKMKSPKAAKEGNYLRFRQADPARFAEGSFKTKTIDRKMGVKLVIGCPKKEKKSLPKTRKINPPVSIPSTLVYLGRAVELSFEEGETLKWRGNTHCVLSNVEGTKLFILPTSKKKAAIAGQTARIDKARALYSKFTDFESEEANVVRLSAEPRKLIGLADHIVYESDKWSGKKVEYIHEFDHRPKVFVDHEDKPQVIALIGKGIKVKREGITG